jgi:HTH-type transcriptional regulator/antitoxin HigA
MDIRAITTPADHSRALAEIERLWGAAPGSEDGERLDLLATLVEHYERTAYPLADSDPVETIRVHMEMTGKSQRDLATLFGSASRASEVLNRRRPLTIEMAYRLNSVWGIPAEALIRPYELELPPRKRA